MNATLALTDVEAAGPAPSPAEGPQFRAGVGDDAGAILRLIEENLAGLGTQLISRLGRDARRAGFSTLCALTHEPSRFVRLGFSIVPHVWFPEKIAVDCTACPKFRECGQHAVALALTRGSLSATGANRLPLAWAPRPAAMTLRARREDAAR
jgi:hypothetical protein